MRPVYRATCLLEPTSLVTVAPVHAEVRRITADEGAELERVRLAALADSPFAFGSTFAAESDRPAAEWDLRARLGASGRDRSTFFARRNGEIVGLAGGHREPDLPDEVNLVSMWTAPTARRGRVGSELVRAVLTWAAETGASRVTLWVTEGNEPARALYERLGFEPTGERQPLPSDPTLDEHRMVRVLDANGVGVEDGAGEP
jgi:RimJ/RimL family protein N-acetyltransferase